MTTVRAAVAQVRAPRDTGEAVKSVAEIAAAAAGNGVELIVDAFAVVIIGGLGSMPGALVGALVVGLTRAAAIWLYPEFEMLAIYVIVIAVLILRPRGLLGKSA